MTREGPDWWVWAAEVEGRWIAETAPAKARALSVSEVLRCRVEAAWIRWRLQRGASFLPVLVGPAPSATAQRNSLSTRSVAG